jgi:hypothetical protein
MSRKILSNVDLAQNELQNARVQNLASAPGSPVTGQVWFNTTTGKIEYRGTSATIDPTARANHTGTQLAATISDLATTVQGYRLDQFAAPTSSLTVNAQRITNVAAPTAASDAANKSYVDGLVNGIDWKPSVRVATTANIALSGTQTIDSVAVNVGDRVLVKNQTTASQNGVYVVAAGAWTRAADADVSTLTSGASFMVTDDAGSQKNTQWQLSTDDPITVGSTALSFVQIGGGTSYTPGTGISIVGNVISTDSAVVVRKFAATFGDGTTTTFAVAHGLGTLDVTVGVYQVADGAEVECEVTRTNSSTVTLAFVVAPTSNSLRVVVHG